MTASPSAAINQAPQRFDGPALRVNLRAVQQNYTLLRSHFKGQECGAVVKANAYGLGVDYVAPALANIGCETFFVATLEEGVQLRALLPEARVLVFHGVGAGEELAFISHRLIPVLNSPQQVSRWAAVARERRDAVSALHVDTGMARLGLTQPEWQQLAAQPDLVEAAQISLLMSHLACAPEANHPQNAHQLGLFEQARARFPGLPCSLANSGGIFLSDVYHYHLARPGCALYGIMPSTGAPNPMHPVAELSAPILQVRQIDTPQAIGYGATCEMPAGSVLATVALGYADGILRGLGERLIGYMGGTAVPLVGRVTMDMLIFDITSVPPAQRQAEQRIEIIGPHQSVDQVAEAAGTIGYEIFSRLGRRVHRTYEGA